MSEDAERELSERIALAHQMGYADGAAAARGEVERLKTAAQPFARTGWPAELEDIQPVGLGDLTVGDFRRLASAMKGDADAKSG